MSRYGEYKNEDIYFDEELEEFFVQGTNIRSKSLKEIKEEIDKSYKDKFEKTAVFVKDYWQNESFIPGVATSINIKGEVFVTKISGERTKINSVDDCYLDNDANRVLIAEILALNLQIKELTEKRTAVTDKLEKLKSPYEKP